MVYRNGEVLYFVSPCTSLLHCPERHGEWKYCPPGWICLFSRIRRIFAATATDGLLQSGVQEENAGAVCVTLDISQNKEKKQP